LVGRDYDKAISFYCQKLHFTLIEVTYQPEEDKRDSLTLDKMLTEKKKKSILKTRIVLANWLFAVYITSESQYLIEQYRA